MNPLNKIGHIVASQTYDKMTPATAKAEAPPVTPVKASSSVAVTVLTDLARQLSKQAPPIDHAKIAQIRTAIAQGHNNVDAEQVATALARHYGIMGG